MKRLLSIVLALVLVLGTLPAFAYDYNVAGKSAGQMLYDNGFIKGNNGDLMEAKKLSRAELAKILCVLYGKEKEAEAFEANHGFTDVPAGHWANPWIAYAKQEGWMKGRNEKTFDPNGTVDEKQLATVLLRVLGFETKDDEYNNAAQIFAAKTAIVLDANKAFSRGQAFDAIWPAVSTPVKADGKILGEVVGKLNPPTPDPLTIKDVQANNLKEIVVKFSKEVKDVTKESFSLSDNLKISNVKLSDDALSVVIELQGKMTQNKSYKLSAKDIKAADAKVPAFVEVKDHEFLCKDQELPVVEGIEFTGPKSFIITFSEPIGTVGKVTVKAGTTTTLVPNPKMDAGKREIAVDMFSTFVADTEYTFSVEDFKDFEGYKNISDTRKITFVKNTEVPTVKVIDKDQQSVTLEFDRPVKGLKKELFANTFTSHQAVDVLGEDGKTSINNKTVFVKRATIVFWTGSTSANEYPLYAGNVKFMIMPQKKIVDHWGNELKDFEEILAITADTEKPVVKSIEKGDSSNVFVVTYSKKMAAAETKYFEVLDKDNNKLAIDGVTFGDDTTQHVITLTNAVADKATVKVSVAGAVDATPNKNAAESYSTSITIPDTKKPEFQKLTYKYEGDTDLTKGQYTVTFWFTEEMADNALELSNYKYTVGGVTKSIKGVASFLPNRNGVKVVLDKAVQKEMFTNATGDLVGTNTFVLNITGVTDLANNGLLTNNFVATAATLPLIDNIAADSTVEVVIKSITVSEASKAVVVFDDVISSFDKDAFEFKSNNSGTALANDKYEVQHEGSKLTFIVLDKANYMKPDLTNFSFKIKDGSKILSLNGFNGQTNNTIADLKKIDRIVPAVVLNPDGTWKAEVTSGTEPTITIDFTEIIDETAPFADLAGFDFKVEYTTDNGVTWKVVEPLAAHRTIDVQASTNDYKVDIQIKNAASSSALDTSTNGHGVRVTIVGNKYTTDKNGNAIKIPTTFYEFIKK